jgi:hypothetical protein
MNEIDFVDFLFIDNVLFNKDESVRSIQRKKIGIFLFLIMSN